MDIDSLSDRDTVEAIAMTLHRESRYYVAPVWWTIDPYDANTVLHNASCFFVEIGQHRFGVTAFHVIAEFLRDRERYPTTRLMVRNTDLGIWEDREIDTDLALDIATFRVSDQEFEAIGARALRTAPTDWAPKPPDVGRGVFFAGYLGAERRVLSMKGIEFHVV
jgi:hypothetical protein